MECFITGTSMISCLGNNTRRCFEAFCNGKSGVNPLQSFDINKYNTKNAYEIIDREPIKNDVKLRATKWLCNSINDAIRSASLTKDKGRVAVIVGTGLRELRSLELWWADGEPFTINELHFGGAIQSHLGKSWSVFTLSNACAASNFALGLAYDLLEQNECDVAIVAGCDSISESMFGILDRVNFKAPERLQPFAENRLGIVMGEGAAAIVLEKEKRNIPIHAQLLGVGISSDAYNETAPDKNGIIRSMADAHNRAAVTPDMIDLLMIHGTGTIMNDLTEAAAINEFFGSFSNKIVITGIKSMIGHTSGASGLIGVITAVECLRQSKIPPTIGVETIMPDASNLDIVLDKARNINLKIAQINAFGFGGVNAVAIIEGKM